MSTYPETATQEILDMAKEDLETLEQLQNNGELQNAGYHPVLRKLHQLHSLRLDELIKVYGYPTLSRTSEKVHNAAWLIVQHSISNPTFMRSCFEILRSYPSKDVLPRHIAFLSDRIAFYERRAQTYGTQFDFGLDGMFDVWWLQESEKVEAYRLQAGLPSLQEMKKHMMATEPLSVEEAIARREEMEIWLTDIGWCTDKDIDDCRRLYGN